MTADSAEGSTPAEPSDAELLRRHVDGDHAAFGALVRRHQDRLWAVALRTIGDRDEAADALQDALLAAYRGAGGFRGDARVTTWLHRIVVNACLDRARRRQARPAVPLPPDDHAADTTAAGGDSFAARELALDIERALGRLPVDQRAALVLVAIEGYPVDEAATLLGVPAGTVKSRCARGRARLATLLADFGPAGPGAATTGNDAPTAGVQPGDRDGTGKPGITETEAHRGSDG